MIFLSLLYFPQRQRKTMFFKKSYTHYDLQVFSSFCPMQSLIISTSHPHILPLQTHPVVEQTLQTFLSRYILLRVCFEKKMPASLGSKKIDVGAYEYITQ